MVWDKFIPGSIGGMICIPGVIGSGIGSAAASGIPIAEWPFEFPARIAAIQHTADAISAAGDVNLRFRRTDVSEASTAFMVSAASVIVADDFTLIDGDNANTVDAEQGFDQGDRVLLDKDAGGSLTRPQVQLFFAF